ncbi:MAG: hypothetical protein JWO63_2282 [Frankiales bacterium]|jgi:hypothetical protein|nr:hypothetical protein [Frankiales bacterium]
MTDRAEMLGQLFRLVADDGLRRPLPSRLCEASRVLLNADGASITVENGSLNRVTLATTDGLASRFEDLQEVLDEGPSLEAYRTGSVVTALLSERRWPELTESLGEAASSLSVYAVPMRPSSRVLGVCTWLGRDPAQIAPDLQAAQFLSDAVGVALLNDPAATAVYGQGGPWAARSEVHQATGMVTAQLKVSPEDALAMLKAYAFAHDLDLLSLAKLVTGRRLDFAPGMADE